MTRPVSCMATDLVVNRDGVHVECHGGIKDTSRRSFRFVFERENSRTGKTIPAIRAL